MSANTRKDIIKSKNIEEHLGVALVGGNSRETHFRWFGHVQRRLATTLVRNVLSMQVDGLAKEKGRLRT